MIQVERLTFTPSGTGLDFSPNSDHDCLFCSLIVTFIILWSIGSVKGEQLRCSVELNKELMRYFKTRLQYRSAEWADGRF